MGFGAVVLGLFLLLAALFLAGRREFQRMRRRGRPFHWDHMDPSPGSLSTPGDFSSPSSGADGAIPPEKLSVTARPNPIGSTTRL